MRAGIARRQKGHRKCQHQRQHRPQRGDVDRIPNRPPQFFHVRPLRRHHAPGQVTRLFAGIGNAYSDEILLRAQLSPFKQSAKISDEEAARLHQVCCEVLTEWVGLLTDKAGGKFPTKVTAFRPGMAVHGRFNEPCPNCATPIQRLRRQDSESNYCPRCQTNGEILADRTTAQLFKGSRPKTIADLAS